MKILKRFKSFLLSLLVSFLLINGNSFADKQEDKKNQVVEIKAEEKEKAEKKEKELEEKTKEKVVYSFTTKSTPEEINGVLKAEKKYILREKKAIDGYKKAKDIEFIVRKDGVEQEIKVINEKDEPKPKTPPKSKKTIPQTNIKNGTVIFSSLLLVSGILGCILFYKKRTEK